MPFSFYSSFKFKGSPKCIPTNKNELLFIHKREINSINLTTQEFRNLIEEPNKKNIEDFCCDESGTLLFLFATFHEEKSGGIVKLITETGYLSLFRDKELIWQFENKNNLRPFAIALSNNGALLAYTTYDRVIHILDVPTLRPLIEIQANFLAANIRFSDDGKLIHYSDEGVPVTRNTGSAFLHHLNTEIDFKINSSIYISRTIISPQNDLMVSVMRGKGSMYLGPSDLNIRNTQNGELIHERKDAHGKSMIDLAITKAGDEVATISDDLTLKIWSLPSADCLQILPIPKKSKSVFYDSDDTRLILIGNDSISFYIRKEGQAEQATTFIPHQNDNVQTSIDRSVSLEKESKFSGLKDKISGLKDKVKYSIGSVTVKLQSLNSELSKIVKENSQMLDMKSKSIKESREGFNALRTYAEKESSDIAGSIVMLADTLSSIENYNERMVQNLRQDYLSILNKLLQDFEGLQQFLKEVELLENNVEKAKQQVAKIQGKPPQNLKPGELQNAEEKLTKLQKELDENKQKVSHMTEDYENKKRDAFQKVFQVLFSNSKEFHSDSLTALYILDGDNSKAPEDTEEGSDEPKNYEIS